MESKIKIRPLLLDQFHKLHEFQLLKKRLAETRRCILLLLLRTLSYIAFLFIFYVFKV